MYLQDSARTPRRPEARIWSDSKYSVSPRRLGPGYDSLDPSCRTPRCRMFCLATGLGDFGGRTNQPSAGYVDPLYRRWGSGVASLQTALPISARAREFWEGGGWLRAFGTDSRIACSTWLGECRY